MVFLIQSAFFVGISVAFVFPVWLLCLVLKARAPSRRSALTRDMLRPPGYSLTQRIEDLSIDLDTGITMTAIGGPAVLLAHLLTSYVSGYPETVLRIVVSLLMGIVWLAMAVHHVLTRHHERQLLKLGLDGELFVGEQLNQLMLHGCRIYHDVPFEYGNIDHVVVSSSGVFSVNTKMHSKQNRRSNNAEVIVDYPAGKLVFPDCRVPLPFPQLESEAKWLSRFLTDAAGFSVTAEPMLALPGWFVKHTGRKKEPYVLNPLNPVKFFVHNRTMFTDQQIQQIAHQLDQRCRDVEPIERNRPKRWED